LILFTDVVAVGARVILHHYGSPGVGVLMHFVVCGFLLIFFIVRLNAEPKLFVVTLGKADAWCAMLGVGTVDCHNVLVVGVTFGQGDLFGLCKGDAVVKEQLITIPQQSERLLDVLAPGYLLLPVVLLWVVYDCLVLC
jgi:hypothetical protein